MKIDDLQTTRLSSNARNKIIFDFFSDNGYDINEKEMMINEDISIHAAALSIYTALLTSQILESDLDKIYPTSNDREIALQGYYTSQIKYKNLTEKQIKEKSHKTILKEIRNSFAHGNFTISYDNTKKELYFLLNPKRTDHNINIPIVISAESTKNAILDICFGFLFSGDSSIESKIDNDLSNLIKKSLIPTQMLKMYDHYLGDSLSHLQINQKRYLLIHHAILSAQITYEQDDYYNIFGKDSNIFEIISLIRNSIIHNSFAFESHSNSISYKDNHRVLNEQLNNNVTYLASAIELKEIILSTSKKNHSKEAITELKDKLLEVLELYFNDMNKINNINSDFSN